MNLRSRYIQKFARVPLHLNYKLLDTDIAGGPARIGKTAIKATIGMSTTVHVQVVPLSAHGEMYS
jgi:hypothetical protein